MKPYLMKTGIKRLGKPGQERPQLASAPVTLEPELPADLGSSLEAMVYKALLYVGYTEDQIATQVPINGGSRLPGGLIIDFVIYTPVPIPVMVNGEYWHRDEDENFANEAEIMFVFGRPPVTIWGNECQTFDDAVGTVQRKVGQA